MNHNELARRIDAIEKRQKDLERMFKLKISPPKKKVTKNRKQGTKPLLKKKIKENNRCQTLF